MIFAPVVIITLGIWIGRIIDKEYVEEKINDYLGG